MFRAELRLSPNFAVRRPCGASAVATHFVADVNHSVLGVFRAELRLSPNLAMRRPCGAPTVATPLAADIYHPVYGLFRAELRLPTDSAACRSLATLMMIVQSGHPSPLATVTPLCLAVS